jgi:hypothetical protein
LAKGNTETIIFIAIGGVLLFAIAQPMFTKWRHGLQNKSAMAYSYFTEPAAHWQNEMGRHLGGGGQSHQRDPQMQACVHACRQQFGHHAGMPGGGIHVVPGAPGTVGHSAYAGYTDFDDPY